MSVVFRDEAHEAVARLVWSGAGRPGVVMCTIDASDGMRALVKRVLSSSGPTVVTRWWWWQAWVGHIVGAYLDGGNGVGKIPP